MKKMVQSADLGGGPVFKKDMREVFNDEVWDAMEALLSPFNSDTEGIIVSGCVISANASNFDMTAGIVYLNGEFMRIAAATNQSFTKYIAPAAVVDDDRQFFDGSTKTLFETKSAELVGSAPGSGQYITINTLTGADDRRLSNIQLNRQLASQFESTLTVLGGIRTNAAEPYELTKTLTISNWDVNTNNSNSVAHGLTATKITEVSVLIVSDSPIARYPLPYGGDGFIGVTSTNVTIQVDNGGFFDSSPDFNGTGLRAVVKVRYEP